MTQIEFQAHTQIKNMSGMSRQKTLKRPNLAISSFKKAKSSNMKKCQMKHAHTNLHKRACTPYNPKHKDIFGPIKSIFPCEFVAALVGCSRIIITTTVLAPPNNPRGRKWYGNVKL